MKILVVNIHSNRNAGDAVLLQVTLQQMRQLFPGCTLTLAMNDPASGQPGEQVVGSFTTWVKASSHSGASWRIGGLLLAPWLLLQSLVAARAVRHGRQPWLGGLTAAQRSLLRAYFDADMVVSCPGNFLYSSGMIGIPLLLAFLTMAYAWLAGKPIYMMPQTIGPLRRRWEFALLRWLLPKLRIAFLRDQRSLALLTEVGIQHPSCYVIPDLAFLFVGAPTPAGEQLLAAYGLTVADQRPRLGVTLLNWGAQNPRFLGQAAYEQAIAEAIEFFIRTYDGNVVLFAQVTGPTPAEDDRTPARRVYERLSEWQDRVFLIDRVVEPDQLQAAYGAMDFFIGTRLHSNIFALTRAVPVLAIAYQYKTHGVMGMLGLGDWVVDIDQLYATQLIGLLQQGWQERNTLRQQLQNLIPTLQAEISAELARVQQDYQQFIA